MKFIVDSVAERVKSITACKTAVGIVFREINIWFGLCSINNKK